eukprot:3214375-Pleurochrysis_carterae.AAC.2
MAQRGAGSCSARHSVCRMSTSWIATNAGVLAPHAACEPARMAYASGAGECLGEENHAEPDLQELLGGDVQRLDSRDVCRGRPPPEPVEPASEPGAWCAVVAAGGVAHDAPHEVVVGGGRPRCFGLERCEDGGAWRVGQHVLPGRQPLSHLRPYSYPRVGAL